MDRVGVPQRGGSTWTAPQASMTSNRSRDSYAWPDSPESSPASGTARRAAVAARDERSRRPGQSTHQALLMLLGHQSNREILRARFRTTMAMTAQARDQSRHLGGRPPYGYRLVDAGPHPNAAHARWGRRLHRLDPDPVTAPHVRWIFNQRLAGCSAAAIVRALNERDVPCPSRHDPARNRHRRGDAWTLRSVAEILANPRYTGRQVRESPPHRPPRERPRRQADRPATAPPTESKGSMGDLPPCRTSRAGQRTGLRRRASDHCHAPAGHRRDPHLPAGRAAALRHMRSLTRLPLGVPQPRLSLPPRAHQRPAARTQAAQEPSTSAKTPRSPTPLRNSASRSMTPNK